MNQTLIILACFAPLFLYFFIQYFIDPTVAKQIKSFLGKRPEKAQAQSFKRVNRAT